MVDYEVAAILDECTNKSNQENSEEADFIYCFICRVTFFDPKEYKQHKLEAHAKKKYPCSYCGASFRRQDHLKRHMNSLHSSNSTEINPPICPICNEEFNTRGILYDHVNSDHNDDNTFYCRECSFECQSLADLDVHESSHLITVKHVCTYCSKPFKRRDHMLRHIKTIHLNHSVKCPKCNQIFKRNDHVARHFREKHKINYFDVSKIDDNKKGVTQVGNKNKEVNN